MMYIAFVNASHTFSLNDLIHGIHRMFCTLPKTTNLIQGKKRKNFPPFYLTMVNTNLQVLATKHNLSSAEFSCKIYRNENELRP